MSEKVLDTINYQLNHKNYEKALDLCLNLIEIKKAGQNHEEKCFTTIQCCIKSLQDQHDYPSIFNWIRKCLQLIPVQYEKICKNVANVLNIPFDQIINSIEIILREKLSKAWRFHFKELSVQISIIALGIKRAFLWDLGPIPTLSDSILIEIVNQINIQCKSNLISMKLADDFLIVNFKCLPLNSNDHIFVDVSKNLSYPKILPQNTKIIIEMTQNLNQQFQSHLNSNHTEKLLEIDLTSMECVPALIGLVIGYPVIYFYDETSNHENCLQNIDLAVHQIKLREFIAMSFSIPMELYENEIEVKNLIQNWKIMFTVATEFKFEDFNKTLDVVIL
uniref:CSON005734 protein n=1 Tax=Culicoides sonorensis TaxID=179676 RepID=A0A336M7F2_CULSO